MLMASIYGLSLIIRLGSAIYFEDTDTVLIESYKLKNTITLVRKRSHEKEELGFTYNQDSTKFAKMIVRIPLKGANDYLCKVFLKEQKPHIIFYYGYWEKIDNSSSAEVKYAHNWSKFNSIDSLEEVQNVITLEGAGF
ncbi:hypothetical protein GCM10023331_30840 [Algivirga pacifica]|uniref:Uncharacterized protein n=2 Tax=Algivirga pacifica TaxID=1162670 RepID=A0ABP9DK29_9BACT